MWRWKESQSTCEEGGKKAKQHVKKVEKKQSNMWSSSGGKKGCIGRTYRLQNGDSWPGKWLWGLHARYKLWLQVESRSLLHTDSCLSKHSRQRNHPIKAWQWLWCWSWSRSTGTRYAHVCPIWLSQFHIWYVRRVPSAWSQWPTLRTTIPVEATAAAAHHKQA